MGRYGARWREALAEALRKSPHGAGLGLEIRNRIQGHALQDVGSRHYDRHSYLEEKRAALEQWERCLRSRLAEGGNVVALQRSRIRHL